MIIPICLVGVFLLGWVYSPAFFTQIQVTPTLKVFPTSSLPPSQTPLPTIRPFTPTLTPEPTYTWVPSPTPGPKPTSIPIGLETPNGATPHLLIHKIRLGESLAFLADRFGTSVEAIRSVNYFLPVPLWEGVLVIIPVNTTDVSALPAFEPYEVKDRTSTLEEVAFALNTTPELVSRYNLVDQNSILIQGTWLVIPRPFPPPTGLPLATPDGKIQNYGD